MAESKSMEEIESVLRKFGDEQSTLLDQFERLSIEVQLNQAILRRSLSEPAAGRSKPAALLPLQRQQQPLVTQEVRQGRRGSGFGKVLKKLLKPFLRRKGNSSNKNKGERKEGSHYPNFSRNPKYCKAFSRSLRF